MDMDTLQRLAVSTRPKHPFFLSHTMSLLNTKRDVEDLFESAGVSIKEDAINSCMDPSPPPT